MIGGKNKLFVLKIVMMNYDLIVVIGAFFYFLFYELQLSRDTTNFLMLTFINLL